MAKIPKITLSFGCLAFLCAYGVFDPYHSFWPFLIAVILHEAGHMIALHYFHCAIREVRGTISGWEIETDPLSYPQEIIVALSGPAVNFILMILSGSRYPMVTMMNVILLLYNLLPLYPLDGGRALRGCLRWMLPFTVAEWIERACGWFCMCSLFGGSLFLTYRLHSGMWPILFCGYLFYRIGETILPKSKI